MIIKDNHKIKTSNLMDNLRKSFKVYSYWDNKELDKEFPPPKKTTTREFADIQESENKGKSRDDLEGEPLMTLREYIIAFEQFFKETGKHLDEVGWTIFQDRLSSGEVALGYWLPCFSEVSFGWRSPDSRDSCMGARSAISLKSSSFASKLPDELVVNGVKYVKANK